MRKVKLYTATSLDGKIARPNGEIDWLPPLEGEDYGYQEFLETIDTNLLGYKTYEVCSGFGEWPYKEFRNYVFSRNPNRQLIPEATLITENPVDFVRILKKTEGKDVWLIGGGEINTLLHDAGLIDEYVLAYIPLILGEGIDMLQAVKNQQDLELYRHQVYKNGVTMLYLRKTVN